MANLINSYFFNKLVKRIMSLEDYILRVGAIKIYNQVGTHTFIVPVGITKILVSGIAAGGGGGGAGERLYVRTTEVHAGGGGGGGGRGRYAIDREIDVTPGETLTIIVGERGTGGAKGSRGSSIVNGTGGTGGTSTQLKRGNSLLVDLSGGTGGGGGQTYKSDSSATYGGSGGYDNGGDGGGGGGMESTSGGRGGETSYFGGRFGNGGKGGRGGGYDYYNNSEDYGALLASEDGANGQNGVFVICFGEGQRYSVINW